MRSDITLMISGFAAGLLIGAFALTSVSASIGVTDTRGDRLRAPDKPALSYSDLDPRGAVRHVEIGGRTVETTDYFDGSGTVVYRADPAARTTTVAKGTVIPTPTPQERDAGHAAPRLVTADAPAGAVAN